MNRYRATGRHGGARAPNPMQGQLPLGNPENDRSLSRLERRCAEDPEFFKRLAEAIRELSEGRSERAERPAATDRPEKSN